MGPYKLGDILMVKVSRQDIESARAVCIMEMPGAHYKVFMVVKAVGLGRVFISERYLEAFQEETASQPTVIDLMNILEDLGKTNDLASETRTEVIRKAIEENYLNEKE